MCFLSDDPQRETNVHVKVSSSSCGRPLLYVGSEQRGQAVLFFVAIVKVRVKGGAAQRSEVAG